METVTIVDEAYSATKEMVIDSPTPQNTETHVKFPHGMVAETVLDRAKAMIPHAMITKESYGLQDAPHPDEKDQDGNPVIVKDANLYGAFNLGWDDHRHEDKCWEFIIAFRNSHVKKYPCEVFSGEEILVCFNGLITGTQGVSARHTPNGWEKFEYQLYKMLGNLEQEYNTVDERITRLQQTQIGDGDAAEIILQNINWKNIDGNKEAFPIFRQYKDYADSEHQYFDAFGERTGWSLYNAFSDVIKPTVLKGNKMRGAGIALSFDSFMHDKSPKVIN